MFSKIKRTYREFPNSFWVLTFSNFIDNIGSFMLMPFIALYLIEVFELSMTQMGIIFIIVGIGNLIGGIIGGALSDKFGRKKCALFGLLSSGIFSLIFVFIKNTTGIYILVGFMGLLGAVGNPARNAMVADILPEKQRAEGFGILRVVLNISASIGPALGGLLASFDFLWLFVGDAISSFITAIIFIMKMPETLPSSPGKMEIPEIQKSTEKMVKKSEGYKDVFLNWRFMIFVFVSGIMGLTYMQLNSTLPVFLTEELLFSKQIYGMLISMNAIMVVVMQFWITRKIKVFPALILMGVGNLLYGIGFGMYGFIATVPLAFLAMIILTIGEMVVAPFSQSVAANFAPEDKRGKYMAVNGMAGIFPMFFGVIGAGAIMDYLDPKIVWYLAGILSFFAATGYVFLHFVTKNYFSQMVEDENPPNDLQSDSSNQIVPETDVLP